MTQGPITIVCGSLQTGGTERHLSQILPGLRARGHALSVFATGPDGPMSASIRAAGIEIEFHSHKQHLPVPLIGGLVALRGQVRALACHIRTRQARGVHAFLGTPTIIGQAAAATARVPFVASKRNQLTRPESFRGENLLEYRALRRASAVIGHSTTVVSELESIGVEAQRLHLVHNGIDTGPFEQAAARRDAVRAAEGWTGRQVAICMANLIPYKRHADLLAALATLSKEDRPLLVCAGAGPTDTLRQIIAAQDLSGDVRLLGARRDIPDLLAGSDVGLLASEHEGFSNALLEYQAAGLPVLASDIGGNRDSVFPGTNGKLFAVGDIARIAKELRQFTHEAETWRAMGQAGRSIVAERFSLSACIDKYDAIYASHFAR